MRSSLKRRDFLKTSLASAAGLALGGSRLTAAGPAAARGRSAGVDAAARSAGGAPGLAKSRVVLVKTADRAAGVAEAMKLLEIPSPSGRNVLIKPNFNTADPAPGSTHNDTLRRLILELRERGAAGVTIGERSGPPVTRKVMEDKGVFDLARELETSIVNFEELPETDWVAKNPPGSHWRDGFAVPRVVAEADYLVSTCCLKTHGFGGIFSMSLKLAVGMTPKRLMREMHGNREHMRRMIAEINTAYAPRFIILDGVEAFVDGGPSEGKKVDAGVILGGTNRVAVDAAGLAVLKTLGANAAIMETRIFDQEQIRRAIELGLGADGPETIELVPAADEASRAFAAQVGSVLATG